MFYKGCKEDNQLEYSAICEELERLKVVLGEQKQREQFQFSDFCKYSDKVTKKFDGKLTMCVPFKVIVVH